MKKSIILRFESNDEDFTQTHHYLVGPDVRGFTKSAYYITIAVQKSATWRVELKQRFYEGYDRKIVVQLSITHTALLRPSGRCFKMISPAW